MTSQRSQGRDLPVLDAFWGGGLSADSAAQLKIPSFLYDCCVGRTRREKSVGCLYPELLKEWDEPKNTDFTLFELAPGSKKPVWWKCKHGHSFQKTPGQRTTKSNGDCPACRSVGFLHPDVAKEWHPTKNGKLPPFDLLPGSNRKVWWQCCKNKKHVWDAIPYDRTKSKRPTGCPYCAEGGRARRVLPDESLAALRPEIASEWHPTKNGERTPEQFSCGSSKRVWWQCSRDPNHEWATRITKRTKHNGTNCPFCDNAKTSRVEIRIYTELASVFPNARWRSKVHRIECDVYLPEYNIAVEVDGRYWHGDKVAADKAKAKRLAKQGIELFRVREEGLPRITDTDTFFRHREAKYAVVQELLRKIRTRICEKEARQRIDDYLGCDALQNDREYRRLVSYLPAPPPEGSLLALHPDVAKEWHQEKNKPLQPDMFSPGSNKRVWWRCRKNPAHEWLGYIAHRALNGSGCPYCSGRRASEENCLATLFPAIARQWHSAKNGKLTPRDVTAYSRKSVWWQCDKVLEHEWRVMIGSRTGSGGRKLTGCPFCSGRRLAPENCLAARFPEIANQWHPTKNGKRTPNDVLATTRSKAWWQCGKNGHRPWQATVANRTVNGTGCPDCWSAKRSSGGTRPGTKDQNLAVLYPHIAAQWHPTKNGDRTPEQFRPFSVFRAWWLCDKGHEWATAISNRTAQKTGCKRCTYGERP